MKKRHNQILYLPVNGDFSFRECLAYLNRSPLECLHRVENQQLFKLLAIDVSFILLSIGEGEPGQIRVEVLNGNDYSVDPLFIKRFIHDWFDLDRDLSAFYQMGEKDPLLNRLVKQYRGLRLIGIPDLWEALCWSIIGQQINLHFAYILKRRLVETFGDKMIYEGNVYWAFPPAQRIAALEAPELKALQFSRQKAEYAIEAARRICRGEISKEKLLALGEMEAKRAALIQLRGVGAWTADYVLMKCLRLSGAFPSADIGLHNAIKHQLNLSQKPSPEEIGRLAQGWKNWEAYATFYLWRSLI